MLDQVKRWFSNNEAGFDLTAMSEWSRQQGWDFKRVREGDGFALDGQWSDKPWRLEWGPSQRTFIQQRELRLRMELHLPSDLQMLVLNRSLAEQLEANAFDQYTQTTQTVIDCSAPEEMRWLAMFPKVNLSCHKDLRSRYGAWSNAPSVAQWWLDGPLAAALEQLAREWLPEDIPFVLMTLRGRLYLRAQIPVPSQDLLTHLQGVFLVAAEQVMRVSTLEPGDSSTLSGSLDTPSTQPGTWSHRPARTAS
ncbi:MAG: hypothetical protein V4739_12090 [Pseudomonadota bacterium]